LREDHARNKIVRLFIYQTQRNHANFTLKQGIAEKEQIAIIIIRQSNSKKSKCISNNIKRYRKLNQSKNRAASHKNKFNFKRKAMFKD
jgi:hypothetical protein